MTKDTRPWFWVWQHQGYVQFFQADDEQDAGRRFVAGGWTGDKSEERIFVVSEDTPKHYKVTVEVERV